MTKGNQDLIVFSCIFKQITLTITVAQLSTILGIQNCCDDGMYALLCYSVSFKMNLLIINLN